MFKGSIEWRGKNKDCARLIVSCGYDNKGKQIKKTKSLGTVGKKEAAKALAAFITELSSGQYIDNARMTFAELVNQWETLHAVDLKLKTVSRYKELLERVLPTLGGKKLNQIKPLDIKALLVAISKETINSDGETLDPQTVHHHYSLLRSIFNRAVDWELLYKSPVTKDCQPRVEKREALFYDEPKVVQLMEKLESTDLKHRALIRLTLAIGCRLGEIVGLRWESVNFAACSVSIRSTLQYVPGKGVIVETPKTKSSIRTCPVPPQILKILTDLRSEQENLSARLGTAWQNTGYVFINDFGRPLHPSTPSRWFNEFLDRNGLEHLNFHGLRHTCATLLLKRGVDVTTVCALLGHSQPSTTLNLYSHATPAGIRDAAMMMGQVLSGKEKPLNNPHFIPSN